MTASRPHLTELQRSAVIRARCLYGAIDQEIGAQLGEMLALVDELTGGQR